MEKSNTKELLCFMAKDMTYAICFSDMVEICYHISVQLIPRLPKEFCGVYHYKGEMVPIVGIDKSRCGRDKGRTVLLVKSGEYIFGICIDGDPWIRQVEEQDAVTLAEQETLGCWREQRVYKLGSEIIHLLDLEKTAEELEALC